MLKNEGLAVVPIGALRWICERSSSVAGKPLIDPDMVRQSIVEIALSEVGNNDPRPYLNDALGRYEAVSWCGIFALWVYRRVGITDIKWATGPRVYGFVYPLNLGSTIAPRPGDLAYFTRNQHHAIVAAATKDEVTLVNGNGGEGKVTITTQLRLSVASFFSIEPLIRKAIEKT
jgi:hypothetical protein